MAGLTDASFPFLSRLSATARRELDALSAQKVAPASRVLERGDAAGGAYLVVGGVLRVFYITSEGREAYASRSRISACIRAAPSTANPMYFCCSLSSLPWQLFDSNPR